MKRLLSLCRLALSNISVVQSHSHLAHQNQIPVELICRRFAEGWVAAMMNGLPLMAQNRLFHYHPIMSGFIRLTEVISAKLRLPIIISAVGSLSGSDLRSPKTAAFDPKPNLTAGWQLRLWA
jgi:hypothetical protein